MSHQSALADISNILSTVSTAQFFIPRIRKALRITRPEIDPALETLGDQPDTVWELKYYNNGMELTNVQDDSFNMELFFYEDDYIDPETILAGDKTPPEMEVEEEEEDVLQGQALSTPEEALATPVQAPSTTATVPQPMLGQSPILWQKTVRFDPMTNSILKDYLKRAIIPDQVPRGTWSPSKVPCTRAQMRQAAHYYMSLEASPQVQGAGTDPQVQGGARPKQSHVQQLRTEFLQQEWVIPLSLPIHQGPTPQTPTRLQAGAATLQTPTTPQQGPMGDTPQPEPATRQTPTGPQPGAATLQTPTSVQVGAAAPQTPISAQAGATSQTPTTPQPGPMGVTPQQGTAGATGGATAATPGTSHAVTPQRLGKFGNIDLSKFNPFKKNPKIINI